MKAEDMTTCIGTLARNAMPGHMAMPDSAFDIEQGVTSTLTRNGVDDVPRRFPSALSDADLAVRDASRPTTHPGRVVIMADMEGCTSVPNDEAAVTPAEETGGTRTPAYAAACREMTIDVLHAIAGARAGGATDIIVADTHWHDTNLLDEDFDVPLVRGSQAALAAMNGADVAMLVGWHAKAGTPAACLPHTYTDRIAKLVIDGHEVGEIGMLRRLIASYAVPVALVSGDFAAHEECGRDDWRTKPSTVVSKFVDAKGHVTHRRPHTVRREILDQACLWVRHYVDRRLRKFRNELIPHHPGQFEVWLQPGFEVPSDGDAELTLRGSYRIRGLDIRESYAAFQRFVDRLPAPGQSNSVTTTY